MTVACTCAIERGYRVGHSTVRCTSLDQPPNARCANQAIPHGVAGGFDSFRRASQFPSLVVKFGYTSPWRCQTVRVVRKKVLVL